MSQARRLVAALLLGAVFLAFAALGTWQVHRRSWKLALIDSVEARVHAAPRSPPGPATWRSITASSDGYRRIRLDGSYDASRQTLVQASTDYGSGWWVVTPLRTSAGFMVLVNRGFVSAHRAPPPAPGIAHVVGLLRVTEPGGGFLRANDPAHDRWYSRDVAAIAHARGLTNTAPYFIDAEKAAMVPGQPIGGLTVIRFPNNHLVYALTWYAMAIMTAFAALFVLRRHA